VRPKRQAVLATADDASIPVSLVQYLWSRWQESPPDVRDAVTAVIGALMLSPRWHWDVTVLRDQSPPYPQGSCVSERAGRPTIGMPIAMLQELWRWVLGNIDERAAVLRWWAINPALWQELRTHQPAHVALTKQEWYRLYGYLSPVLLPDIAQTAHDLLSSANPDDQQMALTMLKRWMASDDHATRDLAAQILRVWLNQQAATSSTNYRRRLQNYQLRLQAIAMLSSSDDPAVVSAYLYHLLRTARNRITPNDVRTMMTLLHGLGDGRSLAMNRWMSLMKTTVRDHPSDDVIRAVLDRLMPTIMPPDRPVDRVRWAATLWTLLTDPTRSDARRQTIATALTSMMQDPMVAALVHGQLCTEPSRLQTIPAPICDTLLKGLIQTAHADAVLTRIAQEIRQDPDAIARFDPIVAAGWGHGHDHRILQIITSNPSPWWNKVLETGITTSVGAEVCAFIQSQVPPDQALAMIVYHIHARERRGDWPLAPLPAYLIPWVGEAARSHPADLSSNTIRRLWLANPVRAWDVTQTMLGSRSSQRKVIDAMDTGWGTGYDAAMATILRSVILALQDDRGGIETIETIETGIATVVAGIGRADPSLIESLLTHLATTGNETVRQQLISALRRGWGRGQDDLVARVLATIADQTVSERVWDRCSGTLIRAWDYQPRDVVVSLIDRLLTHAMNGLVNEKKFEKRFGMVSMAEAAIAAFAPGWDHLPTAQVLERITHHVAHLHAHAHTIGTYSRDTLVAAWASVVTAGAARLSASDFHALLAPLWTLSPKECLEGVAWWVRQ
jgi:hypothetical protein